MLVMLCHVQCRLHQRGFCCSSFLGQGPPIFRGGLKILVRGMQAQIYNKKAHFSFGGGGGVVHVYVYICM